MKKKNLQKYALFAEVIGGIAVLVTLIFLVIETRENTNALQAQTYQSLTAELNVIRNTSITSGFSKTYLEYAKKGFDGLDDAAAFDMNTFSQAVWGVYESAFYARERGVLGPDEYVRFQRAMCRNFKADKEQWFPKNNNDILIKGTIANSLAANVTPKFRHYVEDLCK